MISFYLYSPNECLTCLYSSLYLNFTLDIISCLFLGEASSKSISFPILLVFLRAVPIHFWLASFFSWADSWLLVIANRLCGSYHL